MFLEVRCMNDKEEYTSEDLCISVLGPIPRITQLCHVSCDQDVCKFSDWTEWGMCSQRCNGFQTRNRSMEGRKVRASLHLYKGDYFKQGLSSGVARVKKLPDSCIRLFVTIAICIVRQ